MYLLRVTYTDLPIIPLVHGGGIMMWLRSAVHECAVVLEHVVDIVEHHAVHRREPPRSLGEADVHHGRFVEHRRRVLKKHSVVHLGCTGSLGCNSSMRFRILPESGPHQYLLRIDNLQLALLPQLVRLVVNCEKRANIFFC